MKNIRTTSNPCAAPFPHCAMHLAITTYPHVVALSSLIVPYALRACLDALKNSKVYKILRHIESCSTCIEH